MRWNAALVLTAAILSLLAEVPWIGAAVRTHILQGLVVGFFVLLGWGGRSQENLRMALLRGPSPWLLLLILWCVIETLFPPTRSLGFGDLMRPFALPQLLRIAICAGVFFAVAYALTEGDLRWLVGALLVLYLSIALYGLVQFGGSGGLYVYMTGIFGNHEQIGSLLMLTLPVSLALAMSRADDQKIVFGTQGAAAILAVALLLARSRSAWIGGCCAVLTVVFLTLRFNPIKITRATRFQVIGPIVLLVVGLVIVLLSGELAPLLSNRIATFTHGVEDASFVERVHRWDAASRMTYERPITGWGLGAYPILQRRWTGTGDSPDWAIVHGTGHSNLAHNFYVQCAAETGVVGLTLSLGAVVAFLLSAGACLPQMRPGFYQALLIGSIASTVGACGDMFGSPSYTYPGESVLMWLIMGLGVAACRYGRSRESRSAAALPPTPVWIVALSAATGIAVSLLILEIGSRHPIANHRISVRLENTATEMHWTRQAAVVPEKIRSFEED